MVAHTCPGRHYPKISAGNGRVALLLAPTENGGITTGVHRRVQMRGRGAPARQRASANADRGRVWLGAIGAAALVQLGKRDGYGGDSGPPGICGGGRSRTERNPSRASGARAGLSEVRRPKESIGGSKCLSQQHERCCDEHRKASFGSIGSGAVTFAQSAASSRTRWAAAALDIDCRGCFE